MKKRLFLFQDKLESLLRRRKVELNGNILSAPTGNYAYFLTPAVKVLSCETSCDDPFQFVGKFIPAHVLTDNGADLLLSSFTYKNHSYLVESGFIGTFCQRLA